MAPKPTRVSARTVLTTAGLGAAALVLAAAAAAPAFADGDGNNGNHYGQSKTHTNNGQGASHGQANGKANGQSNGKANGKANGQSSAGSNGSSSDPAGNNGTVFIHDVADDHSPHNVPHVGCTFYVDFFGFDQGQNVSVSFAGQAPTGKGTQLGGSQDLTPVSTDSAGGAGNDWDDEISVTADQLGVSSLGAPAHQGYHIKMTVVTNQPGDHKYKVFWLQPCEQPESTTPSETGTTETGTTETGATETGTTPQTGETPSEVGAVQTGATGESSASAATAATTKTSKIPTVVLGRSITRSGATPNAAPAASSLPFTGAEIGGLAGAAALLLGGGTVLSVAGRRRRRA